VNDVTPQDAQTVNTPQQHRITTTERASDALSVALRNWFADRVGAEGPVELTVSEGSTTGGFSSASILFDATWTVDGTTMSGAFVARTAPEESAMAVFAEYDMAGQYEVIKGVAELSDVPVPQLRWMEPDVSVLGAPFLVMDQARGEVPPDNLPYVFDGWVLEATPGQLRQLQDSSIEILTKIHGIADPESNFAALCPNDPSTALRQHVDAQRAYYRWALADDGIRVPLIERGFDWLEQHWPTDLGPNVLSWGDARIGNMMFQDFEPVAVFDWEMAALGPRELDLGWFIFLHRFFQDLAEMAGLPGLPDFLRRDDVVRTYEELTGSVARDLNFYLVYAALRHAIVIARVKRRSIHFNEDTMPADPDDFVLHRASLEQMLAGTYSWN
jgi:aminoglycoside phosphotransferase (APT) family kinase protein